MLKTQADSILDLENYREYVIRYPRPSKIGKGGLFILTLHQGPKLKQVGGGVYTSHSEARSAGEAFLKHQEVQS